MADEKISGTTRADKAQGFIDEAGVSRNNKLEPLSKNGESSTIPASCAKLGGGRNRRVPAKIEAATNARTVENFLKELDACGI